MSALLLVALLGELGWLFFHRSPRVPRRERYRRWMARAWVRFGLASGTALLLLGRIDALWAMPSEFAAARDWFGVVPGDPGVLAAYAVGLAAGMVVVDAITVWRARRPGGRRWMPDIGMLEAGRGEAGSGTLLAVTAGLTEEPFFRLVLPLLIARVTGDAVVAFVVSAALFGLSHRYQGKRGMILTTISGGVLTMVYLQTGNLWIAAAVHAAIDWNLIVVRPALVRRFSS